MPRFFTLVLAVALGYYLFKTGMKYIRAFGSPPPPPLPDGEIRRVKILYRCSMCGLEIRATRASTEDPAPPHHCMEEMELVQPVDI